MVRHDGGGLDEMTSAMLELQTATDQRQRRRQRQVRVWVQFGPKPHGSPDLASASPGTSERK